MQVADELRVHLRQLAIRTVGECDRGKAVAVDVGGRIETEFRQFVEQGGDTRAGVGSLRTRTRGPTASGAAPLRSANFRGVFRIRQGLRRDFRKHACQSRERRRFEPERGGIGGEEVPVLGPSDAPAAVDFDFEQPDLSHPFEVGTDGVRVERKALGDVAGRFR